MAITGQSGEGMIRLFTDMYGNEIPVGNTEAATTPGHFQEDFSVLGDLFDGDAGLVLLSKASGYGRLTGTDEAGYGCALATEVCFSPALNGTIVVEARVELQVLTARNIFIGLTGTIDDNIVESLTAGTATITKVYPSVGFLFDSQLSSPYDTIWHMPYLLATDSTQTSTDVDASQIIVAGESDVLRLEVFSDGAARWFVNGKLEQSVGPGLAATPGTLLGVVCGCFGTANTITDLDVDYLLVTANRDWTR